MTAAKAAATAEATSSGATAAGMTTAEAAAKTTRSAKATEAAGTSGTARTAAPSGTAKAPEEGTPCHAGEYHQKDDDDNHKENEIQNPTEERSNRASCGSHTAAPTGAALTIGDLGGAVVRPVSYTHLHG